MTIILNTTASLVTAATVNDLGAITVPAHPASLNLTDDFGFPDMEVLTSADLETLIAAGDVTLDNNGTTIDDTNVDENLNTTVTSVNEQTGVITLDTDDLNEGSTNLYYTEARVNANTNVAANTAKVSADGSVTTHSDITNAGSGSIIQNVERNKLDSLNLRSTRFTAFDFNSPNNADWAVNAFANINTDSNNNALVVRQFDDTNQEGVGLLLDVPASAIQVILGFTFSRQTAGAAQNIRFQIYSRTILSNTPVSAWNNPLTATLGLSPDTNYGRLQIPLSLGALGLTAGALHQIELVRNATDPGDTLVGDWNLLYLEFDFR